MSQLEIPTARVFAPLLQPARYKGAHGGRGSGKSHFFAGLMVETALMKPGFRGVCIREVQKSLKESAKRLIEDKIQTLGLGSQFETLNSETRTPGGGVIIYQGMQNHTAESIKSLEGFDAAWVEEAHTLTDQSLTILRPTLRSPGSELWFSWNPHHKQNPVDQLFRGAEKPTGAVSVQANWSDNPWFPPELEIERSDCIRLEPEMYDHIWEGGYAKVVKGAYYAASLATAQREGRIGRVSRDPMMPLMSFWDPGGTKAVWVAQWVGREIRVLDYKEARNQPLSFITDWLRERGYGSCECILPHDGTREDEINAVRFEDHIRNAGFKVRTIGNQGKGAALRRIEASRRLFPAIWFNEATTEAGREALGAYQAHYDDSRKTDLGPLHDWSSHGADAFGLMCVAYEEPQQARPKTTQRQFVGAGGWMG